MKTSIRSLFVLLLVALLPASAQVLNTKRISNLSLGADAETRDLWAEGNFIYVARGPLGLDIINANNQAAPVRVANILPLPHADISDVVVRNGIAYLANEVANGSPTPFVGLFMYDVSTPASPVYLGRIAWGEGAWYHLGVDAHNLTVEVTPFGPRAYIASGITGQMEIFDVSNPALAVYLGYIPSPLFSYHSQAHDTVVRNNLAYTAWLGGGFTIHDITDPALPVLLAHVPNGGTSTYTYHVALTPDGQFLCTTDEAASGPDSFKIWNVSNPGAVTLAGTYVSPTGALPHNLAVHGKYAYLAHTEDGLRILDIGNPSAPRSVGWYDPDPAPIAHSFIGGWGVFPTANNIYLSHTSRGLYVIDFVDTVSIVTAEWHRSTRVLTVEATSTAAPSPTLTVSGYGVMTYNVGTGRYVLNVTTTSTPNRVTVTSDLGASATENVRKR